MKWLILFLTGCFFKPLVFSQISKLKSLELSAHIRHELQGHYVTQYGTLPYLTDLKLAGTSLGADLGFKMQLTKKWYIIPSIGYYKFSINDIVNNGIPALPWGTTNFRDIDYRPDSTPIGYKTRKYHYNNLSLGIALGKEFVIKSKFQITTDILFNYLLNYSQKYYIGEVSYSTNTNNAFGYVLTGRLGINRTLNNFYIGTCILLPVYKQFRKDKVLLDNPNEKVDKWFGGYGLAFRIGKYL